MAFASYSAGLADNDSPTVRAENFELFLRSLAEAAVNKNDKTDETDE